MLHGHSCMVQVEDLEELVLEAEDRPVKRPAEDSEEHELEAEDRPVKGPRTDEHRACMACAGAWFHSLSLLKIVVEENAHILTIRHPVQGVDRVEATTFLIGGYYTLQGEFPHDSIFWSNGVEWSRC